MLLVHDAAFAFAVAVAFTVAIAFSVPAADVAAVAVAVASSCCQLGFLSFLHPHPFFGTLALAIRLLFWSGCERWSHGAMKKGVKCAKRRFEVQKVLISEANTPSIGLVKRLIKLSIENI